MTPAARMQARLVRGAGRLRSTGGAYILGHGLDLGGKAGRWSALGLGSFVTEQMLAAGGASCATCLAAGTIALLGGCWHYGAHPDHPAYPEHSDQPAPDTTQLGPEPHTCLGQGEDRAPGVESPRAPAAVSGGSAVSPDAGLVVEPTPPPTRDAAGVSAALAACGITGPKVLGVSARPWGEVVQLEVPRGAKVLHERLDQVQAALRLPEGGLSFQVNPRDTGIITLRLRRRDPFTNLGAPFHHHPRSLSVCRPLTVGLEMDGAPFLLQLIRVHMALVGGTGSGKSSALWTLIDVLSACDDVVLLGIDLTGSPALMAWGDVIQELATTPEQAEALLKRLLKMGRGRCAELGERSRPRLGHPAPDLASENWQPSPAGPQIVLICDEYPALVEAGLWPYIATMLKELRKGGITVLLASQRATRNEMGSSTVKTQLALKALLSCEPEDVRLMLGPGMHARGWAPDRLQPALGEEPYDAGISYVYGGAHVNPVPKKFYRLTLTQVHHRALERMAAGLPQIDAATLAHAADQTPVHLDLTGLGAEDATDDPELTDQQERLLQAVVDHMTRTDTTRAHLRTLADALTTTDDPQFAGLTAADLGVMLRTVGVETIDSVRIDGKVNVGVLLDTVARRLNAAPGTARD